MPVNGLSAATGVVEVQGLVGGEEEVRENELELQLHVDLLREKQLKGFFGLIDSLSQKWLN